MLIFIAKRFKWTSCFFSFLRKNRTNLCQFLMQRNLCSKSHKKNIFDELF